MTDHIPDPGRHRTLFYGHYANRVRGERTAEEPGQLKAEEHPAKRRRCSASWARLISKVFHADPLTCRKRGGKLKVIAYITEGIAIHRILDALGLSPPEDEKPPPGSARRASRPRRQRRLGDRRAPLTRRPAAQGAKRRPER